ncbi:MAG: TonB-dependent receptor plug domain-containing protein, partial [Deltaproteobacteria bacterium]|nr:TonB-dependent receptor plug domain-containing protein [Deltaproteobacteria bacterium]
MNGFRASTFGRGIGLCAVLALGLAISSTAATADEAAWTPSANAEAQMLSIEELIHIKVTSVSSAATRWMDSPAAVYVVTAEDIRRSGALTIQDALRQVPGMNVAQLNGSSWAISTRGENSEFADKMLVMIDGRSVYSPLFSGTYWDVQDVIMEDIDRIEVIRGPGATIWGANAVNGIINVLTKKAKDTQGGEAVALAGNQDYSSSLRWGDELPSGTGHYRAWAKGKKQQHLKAPDHSDGDTDITQGRVGFRADWTHDEVDAFTVSGDGYVGENGSKSLVLNSIVPYEGEEDNDDVDVSGGHILGVWDRELSETSNLTLQSYVDFSRRETAALDEDLLTFDIDFKHRFQPTENNYVTWGFGYRFYQDELDTTPTAQFDPDDEDLSLYSAFIQNEFRAYDDRLRLTAGAKIEDNHFTGTEIQPSVRFAWLASEEKTFWGSISRAVQTRNRLDDGFITFASFAPYEPVPGSPAPPFPEAFLLGYSGDDDADATTLY